MQGSASREGRGVAVAAPRVFSTHSRTRREACMVPVSALLLQAHCIMGKRRKTGF